MHDQPPTNEEVVDRIIAANFGPEAPPVEPSPIFDALLAQHHPSLRADILAAHAAVEADAAVIALHAFSSASLGWFDELAVSA